MVTVFVLSCGNKMSENNDCCPNVSEGRQAIDSYYNWMPWLVLGPCVKGVYFEF